MIRPLLAPARKAFHLHNTSRSSPGQEKGHGQAKSVEHAKEPALGTRTSTWYMKATAISCKGSRALLQCDSTNGKGLIGGARASKWKQTGGYDDEALKLSRHHPPTTPLPHYPCALLCMSALVGAIYPHGCSGFFWPYCNRPNTELSVTPMREMREHFATYEHSAYSYNYRNYFRRAVGQRAPPCH